MKISKPAFHDMSLKILRQINTLVRQLKISNSKSQKDLFN